MDSLAAHLQTKGDASPFHTLEQRLTEELRKNDDMHSNRRIRPTIEKIMQDTYTAIDHMVDRAVDDPKEKPIREALGRELAGLRAEYADICEELARIKKLFGIESSAEVIRGRLQMCDIRADRVERC